MRSAKTLSVILLCVLLVGKEAAAQSQPEALQQYPDLAEAAYGDALTGARALQTSIDDFLAHPDEQLLTAARTAWKAARVSYMQTEGFRFGNETVDAWEPKVNSWPVDEGLIDYVAPKYGTASQENPLYAANVLAARKIRIDADEVAVAKIDDALLRRLQGAAGATANVATGYHAIEFLLWGQDLHGTGPGAGERPASDYDLAHCTHGNCDRRAAYLKHAAALLVADLAEMTADWGKGGAARKEFEGKGADGFAAILTGLGSLSFGEMAGERMKLGLMLHDPEEEQDCFSDNTHNAIYYDEVGIAGIWRGTHTASDGKMTTVASLRDYVQAKNPAAAARMDAALAATDAALGKIKKTADSGTMAYDQMIASGNVEGNKLVQDGIAALTAQTRAIEGVVAALGTHIDTGKSDAFKSAKAP
ncbi:MAG TPA: imelysin family protein [Rhizomicrobium sp.]|jgi:putative iron-regulated protein|nr:imelysin family protein [Rhizomicrobium sp.]